PLSLYTPLFRSSEPVPSRLRGPVTERQEPLAIGRPRRPSLVVGARADLDRSFTFGGRDVRLTTPAVKRLERDLPSVRRPSRPQGPSRVVSEALGLASAQRDAIDLLHAVPVGIEH